ncbi:MAG: NAD(P)/FAD-dependent oxidoreductase [Actinomycetota bacterium]|nr:NAD(P)/FAD-dependent oxidoreductase [Actinomycetota bacterium]
MSARRPPSDHVDVLIVGAGLSGIGCAHHLQARQPGKTYAILEARGALGGTWDLFRYPGIRSDSDLQTLGYVFKPWTGEKAIADGPAILEYVRATAAENGIDRHIRLHHRVVRAEWSTAEACWTVHAERTDTGEGVRLTAAWLFSAGGYYRYDEGYTPRFEGRERFGGPIVHPQQWPEDLDYAGKRVVVIGSGATAVTLVPAMTDRAAHVTMLQRSPSYVISIPSTDAIANALRRLLGDRRGYDLTRRKNIWLQAKVYSLSRSRPGLVKRVIRAGVRHRLPEGYAVDTHFRPRYDPWDQRLCVVPDGDLFKAISAGDASIVTDAVETFTERGLKLASGAELEADIVITATGLNLLAFGGVQLVVDGREIALPDTLAYKSMMLSGVPNFAYAVGYTNASWTLKVDLVCAYLCRLIAYLDAQGQDYCVPEVGDTELERRPLLDLSAGYVQRSVDDFPRQGSVAPWQLNMSYAADAAGFRDGAVEDGSLRVGRRALATHADALVA